MPRARHQQACGGHRRPRLSGLVIPSLSAIAYPSSLPGPLLVGPSLIFEHSCGLPRRGIMCAWTTARDTLERPDRWMARPGAADRPPAGPRDPDTNRALPCTGGPVSGRRRDATVRSLGRTSPPGRLLPDEGELPPQRVHGVRPAAGGRGAGTDAADQGAEAMCGRASGRPASRSPRRPGAASSARGEQSGAGDGMHGPRSGGGRGSPRACASRNWRRSRGLYTAARRCASG